jgi:hypothetical protein
MRKWLILIAVLLSQAVQAVPVWTWVDANGTVHYSDTPAPGARQIELSGAQGFSAPREASRRPVEAAPPATPDGYQTLRIASPTTGETLWNIGGTLTVQVELAPQLAPTHRLDLVFDGQRARLDSNRLQFQLPNVFRGEHTLQAVVVGADGKVVQSSAPVPFVVQQTSIQNPNSLPGRRRAGQSAN